IQRRNRWNRNQDRDIRILLLNIDQRYFCVSCVERKTQRFNIRVRIHVSVQGRLRNSYLDIRPPISNALSGNWAGLDEEGIADFIGKLFYKIGRASCRE